MNKQQILRVLKSRQVLAVVSAGTGATAGYLVAQRVLEKRYAEISHQEIEQAKVFYANLQKPPLDELVQTVPVEEQDSQVAEAIKAITQYQGILPAVAADIELGTDGSVKVNRPMTPTVPNDEPNVQIEINVFDRAEDPKVDEITDEERDARKDDKPFIISEAEFIENDNGHQQDVLTWYDGDGVMADHRDQPIDNWERIIGRDNLQFGHGSDDAQLVYVRYFPLSMDWEIHYHPGKYSREVMGFLEHADTPRRRKSRPRWDDDER